MIYLVFYKISILSDSYIRYLWCFWSVQLIIIYVLTLRILLGNIIYKAMSDV